MIPIIPYSHYYSVGGPLKLYNSDCKGSTLDFIQVATLAQPAMHHHAFDNFKPSDPKSLGFRI